MSDTKTEDTLITAWREAREQARRFYDRAMADADKLYSAWQEQQAANAVRGAALSTATWEDRLAALQVLAEVTLRMRKPGDWYVSQSVSIGGDGFLTSSYGNGSTPQEAVEQHWHIYTLLPEDRYIALTPLDSVRRRARWDGDAWKTWAEERADA